MVMLTIRGLALAAAFAFSGAAAEELDLNLDPTGAILNGYDPVAYFEHGTAVEGSRAISRRHRGADVRFSSEDHRTLFDGDPEAYFPQFGGYCAFGVRMGHKIPSDPKAWEIVDGRLFVFLDLGTEEVWRMAPKDNIAIADKVWPRLGADTERQP
ncbi:MAG: YHS domain-containing (seleno)protein [Paracoccaceae bacterium]